MEYKLYLLRHAKTQGNLAGKYIGITDEPLSKEGIDTLGQCIDSGRYPAAEHVFASPMLRCRQTMERIYPGIPCTIVPEFAECNFGMFENKSYQELKDNPEYQSWIDSGGKGLIPEGEDILSFKARCCSGFEAVLSRIKEENLPNSALIIHGGTIMAVLEEYSGKKTDFYHWQIKNCEGYQLLIDGDLWSESKRIAAIMKL